MQERKKNITVTVYYQMKIKEHLTSLSNDVPTTWASNHLIVLKYIL